MPNSPTCLFTNAALSSTTKLEHTIPASMGGRVASQSVTSDAFNSEAGRTIDFTLKVVYEPLLNLLSPLLPSTAQAGKMPVDVPGEPAGLVVERGRLSRSVPVIEKNEAGIPTSIRSSTEKPIGKLTRELGKDPAKVRRSVEPATSSPVFLKRIPLVCREVELAALKASLATFDVLLTDPLLRFTRMSDCDSARTLVHDAVMRSKVRPDLLRDISLGLQYEKLGLYHEMRRKLSAPITPFEHVMFVLASTPCHCLDVVWLVFGFDPFGFRISRQWSGRSFSCAVVNPILAGHSIAGPEPLVVGDDLLCMPTNRCCLPSTEDETELENVLDMISSERRKAYSEAVALVEASADEHIVECMKEAASLCESGKKDAQRQIALRVRRMFGRRQDDPSFCSFVDDTCQSIVRSNGVFVSDVENATPEQMRAVVATYRQCLEQVRATYGPLGDAFQNSRGIILDPSDGRLVGDLPDMK